MFIAKAAKIKLTGSRDVVLITEYPNVCVYSMKYFYLSFKLLVSFKSQQLINIIFD